MKGKNAPMPKIQWNRQGNVIISFFLIHFVFFGYLCLVYENSIGENLLFLYLAFISPTSIFSLPILIVIIGFLVLREDFFEYGIRTSLWFIPIIICESWIWYGFIYGFDFSIITTFFTRIEGYLTILIIFGVTFVTAFIAAYLKEKSILHYKKLYGVPRNREKSAI